MNIYALLTLCASAISITLGFSVYVLNQKSRINQLFMLVMLANAYWAFCIFMLAQSQSLSGAVFWGKALFLWPFLISLMLHFTFVFTESDWLKNRLVYVALYLPALLFSFISLGTDWISGVPTLKLWGYAATVPLDSVMSRVKGIWAAVTGLLVIFFFTSYYNRVIDKTRKQQTKYVAVSFTIPIILSLLTDSIFPTAGISFPVLGCIAGSLTSIFVVYAMFKYELFSFRSEIAAENIFCTMPDSILLVSLKGLIIKVNRSLVELTGFSEEELVGKTLCEIMQKGKVLNRANVTPEMLAQLQSEREVRNYEITFYTKTGQKKAGMISCSMVTDNNGEDVGAAFVLHDITERQEMEQKLLRAERFASIGELAGMLGHDLRNPLSGIRGATYYLRRKLSKKLDAEDIAMFESIDKSIDYSNKIINDLLDYSNEIRLQLTPVAPKALIADSLAFASAPSNIKVTVETQNEPEFMADETKIRRVFVNIIKNAFDAMPNGGELQIKCVKIGEALVFVFEDNGPGMSKETLENLWTPLHTTKAKGMGFGLAICKRHIEAHEGKIALESVLGRGTTVKVELPLRRVP
jgi:PAS domain S-box-containing protein